MCVESYGEAGGNARAEAHGSSKQAVSISARYLIWEGAAAWTIQGKMGMRKSLPVESGKKDLLNGSSRDHSPVVTHCRLTCWSPVSVWHTAFTFHLLKECRDVTSLGVYRASVLPRCFTDHRLLFLKEMAGWILHFAAYQYVSLGKLINVSELQFLHW